MTGRQLPKLLCGAKAICVRCLGRRTWTRLVKCSWDGLANVPGGKQAVVASLKHFNGGAHTVCVLFAVWVPNNVMYPTLSMNPAKRGSLQALGHASVTAALPVPSHTDVLGILASVDCSRCRGYI
eukprot:GHRR01033544.1.p1 GENE.GHRR01033544.1~~GHRR01033544.1.p1  ORF type:complete len:125 (+),score=7.65 GHRR01033544.1:133-507(+)